MTTRDAGMFAISFGMFLVELVLTRIFSVVMFHHHAFFVVSLAMLGIGVGGVVAGVRAISIAASCVAFGVTTLLAAWIACTTPVGLEADAETLRRGAFIACASLVPFTIAGVVIARVLATHVESANRLYGFDLLGAGTACVAFVPLVERLGAPSALLVAAAFGPFAAAMFGTTRVARGVGIVGAIAFACLALVNAHTKTLDVRFAKGGPVGPSLVTRWNAFSRIEVHGTPAELERVGPPQSWGLSTRVVAQARELHILYDAGAATQIVGFDGDPKKVDYLLWDVTSAAHHVRRQRRVLVIGAGGGRDVVAALAAGSDRIVGVEINPITIDLVKHAFGPYSGHLYTDVPNVAIVNEDGRTFVKRTTERFDLIQASLVDTWAASSAGAYALAENSLYTVEAFDDYFASLEPDGMVSFSRWYLDPPVEALRIVALAREALLRRGVVDPSAHVIVVRTDPKITGRQSMATIVVKRTPFTPDEIAAMKAWTEATLFDMPYVPDGGANAFRSLLGPEHDAFVANAPADLSPTTDDRPFFFDRVPLAAWIGRRVGLSEPPWASNDLTLGGKMLGAALVVTAASAVVLFLLPLAIGRRRTALAPRIVDFACLGLAYVVVEIVLVQRLNLHLGNPSYALTIVLSALLASSGVGAMIARRWSGDRPLAGILAAACTAVVVLGFAMKPALQLTSASTLPLRVLTAFALVAPIGLVLGMPFPTALRCAAKVDPSLVAWAWAANGGMSVFGSVLAVVISMSGGFSVSIGVAALTYAVALLLAVLRARAAAPA